MIKNFIFDMGNVLIKFEPKTFVNRLELEKKDREFLLDLVFNIDDWINLDKGTMDESQLIKHLKNKSETFYHPYIERLVNDWDKPLIEIDGMEDLIKELNNRGYNIYLLSNASSRVNDYFYNLNLSKYFDGLLISADVKEIKPNSKIYNILFDKFNIKPEESFFIDDRKENIEGGKKLGMAGHVFDGDIDKLKSVIYDLIQ